MIWDPPLKTARLIKRYKRFLADIELDGELLTVHVPNTGGMTTCWEPDWTCAVSHSKNPSRKMPYTLELTWNGESWIGVNSAFANKVVAEWLSEGLIPELSGYPQAQPEKKFNESRVDFYLDGHSTLPGCYVEVKSVTLKFEGVAQFPDVVSLRAQKHLRELMALKDLGFRAVIFFLVQREDVSEFKPASLQDPAYAKLLKEAAAKGVEILVYQSKINPRGIAFGKSLPCKLD